MSEAFPGQAAYVQKVLMEHPGLHYLILRDIQRVKLSAPWYRSVEFSPFAKEVATRLRAAGLKPQDAKKQQIVAIAVELSRAPTRKHGLRVVKLSHRDGKKRYIEHLKRRIDAENALILRAAARIDRLQRKIILVKAMRS